MVQKARENLEKKEKGGAAVAQHTSPRRPSSDEGLAFPQKDQNTDSRMPTTMAEFRRVLAVEMALEEKNEKPGEMQVRLYCPLPFSSLKVLTVFLQKYSEH